MKTASAQLATKTGVSGDRFSGRFLSALIVVAMYLLLVWLVSGLSRSAGLFVWSAGAATLALCLWTALHGNRRPLCVACLIVVNLAFAVGCGEVALRVAPQLLSGWVANHAYGGYHCHAGGIYLRDSTLGFALKPNLTRDLYWNGHWWRHQTNAAGYRGAEAALAEVVFLGDSMIYGHGVDNEHTVPSQFQKQTSYSVANLGQQGTCLVQMAARFRRTGVDLQPRLVFVCCHYNDIAEATYWYTEAELQRFLQDTPYEPLARSQFQPRPWWRADQHLWDARLAPSLRLTGALEGGFRMLSSMQHRPDTTSQSITTPPAAKRDEKFAPWDNAAPASDQLGWKVHCRAAANLRDLCLTQGARLVLFDLGYPHQFSQAIEDLAKQLEVDYSPAGRMALTRALEGDDIYLANDGHWSPAGCELIAQQLARDFR